MKARHNACLCIAAFLALLAGCRGKQPTQAGPGSAYRGVKWGSSEKEARRTVQFTKCEDDETFAGVNLTERICTSNFKLNSEAIEDRWTFIGDRLTYVSGSFETFWPDGIRNDFVSKYGVPQQNDTEHHQLSWVRDGTSIVLTLPEKSYGFGNYIETTREFEELQALAAKAKINQAKKAL